MSYSLTATLFYGIVVDEAQLNLCDDDIVNGYELIEKYGLIPVFIGQDGSTTLGVAVREFRTNGAADEAFLGCSLPQPEPVMLQTLREFISLKTNIVGVSANIGWHLSAKYL